MRRLAPVLAGLMGLALLAGCADSGKEPSRNANLPIEEGGHDHGPDMTVVAGHAHLDLAALAGFRVDFKGCREAGGVSLYDMREGTPGPTQDFRRKGIQDDTGNPLIGSYFVPITQESTGIWHISLACDSYAYDGQERGPFEGGWVGVRVFPPAWDTSGIQRQYFVADLSFNDGDIVDRIHHATGLHASRTLDTKIDWLAPNVLHTILDDEDHGVFETHGKVKAWQPKDPLEKVRFWMLINPQGHGHAGTEGSNPECACVPIAFDLESTGGDYWVFDGMGWLSHSRTDAHGGVPAATGNVGGMAYVGFDRTLMLGPVPPVVVEQTWLH